MVNDTQAQQLAEAVGRAMFSRDSASQGLGMTLEKIAPGQARMTMEIREDMVNGHQICHGGMIFTLADSAFAFACNSYNQNTVALKCSIDFLAPAYLGDTLTAQAVECALSGRTGLYDVSVRNQDGRLIALLRGNAYRIKGAVIEQA